MKYNKNKWYDFDVNKGYSQVRPPERKYVLVQRKNLNAAFPDPVCLGYLKNAAGDKQCPYFVTPGMDGSFGDVYRWNDCLPDDFIYHRVFSAQLRQPQKDTE